MFVVYSIADEISFQTAPRWLEEAQLHAGSDIKRSLIATKSDLDLVRAVTRERGEEMAAKYKMPFFEVSAKTGSNVEAAFQLMAESIFEEKTRGLGGERNWRGDGDRGWGEDDDLPVSDPIRNKGCGC